MTPVTRETPGGRAYLDLQNRARRARRGTQELLTLYVVQSWLASSGTNLQTCRRPSMIWSLSVGTHTPRIAGRSDLTAKICLARRDARAR
jgi:hypothetical protein